MRPSLSVLIVAWNSREELGRTLPALLPELREGDELIVVDNDSDDGTAEVVLAQAPAAQIVRMGRNAGFAGGCNAGAEEASGDLLVILNPDAAPLPGWGEAIRRPWLEGRGWAAWQALVAEAGGARSTRPATRSTSPASSGRAATGVRSPRPQPPARSSALSGACLAIPLRTWRELGGFAEHFFLYHEDVDLSLRLRLRGDSARDRTGRGRRPRLRVRRSNEHKWRWLERNRLAILVRVYPAPLLLLLAPALLATELVLLAVAAGGGWGGQKLRANAEALRWLPRLLRERRADPARPRRQQRRVRLLADPGPRLARSSPPQRARSRSDSPSAPTGRRAAPPGPSRRGERCTFSLPAIAARPQTMSKNQRNPSGWA